VGLIDDDRVVLLEQPIALRLGKENAIGHQFDKAGGQRVIAEADFVADGLAEWRVQFLCDACGDRSGGDSARLGVADEAIHAAADVEANLWQLRCLPAAGFAAEDDDLIGGDRIRDYLAFLDDGEWIGIRGLGEIRQSPGAFLGRSADFIGDRGEHFVCGLVAAKARLGGPQSRFERMAIDAHAVGELGGEGLRFEEHGEGTLRTSRRHGQRSPSFLVQFAGILSRAAVTPIVFPTRNRLIVAPFGRKGIAFDRLCFFLLDFMVMVMVSHGAAILSIFHGFHPFKVEER